MDRLSEQNRQCIADLTACHNSCLSSAMTRMLESAQTHRPQHLRLMMDCAAACTFAADALARKSQFHAPICALCADICDTSAQDLQQLPEFYDCAEACRRAASSARYVARIDHAEILSMASKVPPEA